MNVFGSLQAILVIILLSAAFVLEVWAVVDCALRKNVAFVTAGKRSKQFWLILTGASAFIGLLSMPPLYLFRGGFLMLLPMAAAVAGIVYLVDVRPMVRGPRRMKKRPPRSGGW